MPDSSARIQVNSGSGRSRRFGATFLAAASSDEYNSAKTSDSALWKVFFVYTAVWVLAGG